MCSAERRHVQLNEDMMCVCVCACGGGGGVKFNFNFKFNCGTTVKPSQFVGGWVGGWVRVAGAKSRRCAPRPQHTRASSSSSSIGRWACDWMRALRRIAGRSTGRKAPAASAAASASAVALVTTRTAAQRKRHRARATAAGDAADADAADATKGTYWTQATATATAAAAAHAWRIRVGKHTPYAICARLCTPNLAGILAACAKKAPFARCWRQVCCAGPQGCGVRMERESVPLLALALHILTPALLCTHKAGTPFRKFTGARNYSCRSTCARLLS